VPPRTSAMMSSSVGTGYGIGENRSEAKANPQFSSRARSRARALLMWSWVAAIVGAMIVVAISLSTLIYLATVTYSVRTSVSAMSICWSLSVDVDFRNVPVDDRPGYQMCGGSGPRTVAVGRCETRVGVFASATPQLGDPPSYLTVEIFRADELVVSRTLNATGGTNQFVQHMC